MKQIKIAFCEFIKFLSRDLKKFIPIKINRRNNAKTSSLKSDVPPGTSMKGILGEKTKRKKKKKNKLTLFILVNCIDYLFAKMRIIKS